MNNKTRRKLNNIFALVSDILASICLRIQEFLRLANWYHPHPIREDAGNKLARASIDRLEAIRPHLPTGPYSVLDIGCQEGYFLFKLSENEGLKVGVDIDKNALRYASTLARLNDKTNLVFVLKNIESASDLEIFPEFDVIICMSVYHHWVKRYGEEEANSIVEAIAKKTKKILVFDTGEPSEVKQSWAGVMQFLNPSVLDYFDKKFKEFNFKEVTSVGRSTTNLSSVKRDLIIAKK